MANLVGDAGDAYSNLVSGEGTNEAVYTMPGSVALNVESVVATIANGAGSASGATLTIRDPSGQVIATKRQGDTIPAGDTGTATWALRLADDGGGIKFGVENEGTWLHIFTSHAFGIIIEDDGGGGILLAAAGLTKIIADGGFQLVGTGLALLEADSFISNADSWDISTQASGTALESTGPITIDTAGGADKITLRVPVGASVEVQDASQNPIFRVDEDGDLHGKTGKALVFDL